MVVMVAGCGSATASPDDSQAGAGEAYVISILDGEGPYFDVRVDAVAPTGANRPIGSFVDVHPAGWDEASPYYDMRTTVGPRGILPIVVERNGGVQVGDVRTQFLDPRSTGATPVEVAGNLAGSSWSPDGQLAVDAGDGGIDLIDVRTGARHGVTPPRDVQIVPGWLADASGWPALRAMDDTSVAGRLSLAGVFTDGAAATYQVTGLERTVGARGGGIGIAASDGPNQSETAITEFRSDLPGPCQCVVWARNVQPGDDAAFGEPVWDASGTGIWLIFTRDDRTWLSHLLKPLTDQPIVDLPRGNWVIAGISSDDRWIVVSDADARSLVVVDTAAGAAREIARAQGEFNPTPMFGGWVR